MTRKPALVVSGHVLSLLIALVPMWFFLERPTPGGWLVYPLLCLAIGVVAAGAGALLFGRAQSQRAFRNFIVGAWLAAGLVTLMGWASSEQQKIDAARAASPIDWDKGVITPPPAEPSGPWTQYQQPNTK